MNCYKPHVLHASLSKRKAVNCHLVDPFTNTPRQPPDRLAARPAGDRPPVSARCSNVWLDGIFYATKKKRNEKNVKDTQKQSLHRIHKTFLAFADVQTAFKIVWNTERYNSCMRAADCPHRLSSSGSLRSRTSGVNRQKFAYYMG